ncbi:MAG: hypothetical protein COB07_08815 [Sulfurovum sp.]|nr:MAG: hypothetical protein COB07_08815 [Sulfurovum sp.]
MTNNKPLKHFIGIMFQGLFWLLPIVAIMIILSWLYRKIELLIGAAFRVIGFSPEHNMLLWEVIAIIIFLLILYLLGWLIQTRLAHLFELIFCKIPGYSTIKGLVGIFNSSKKGQHQVLVVAVKGFGKEGYNIGLMYSQKESIIKDHYTVTLSMSPIPNGGFMFEMHKEKILIIENASFDNNLQYLLSMGTKSFADILNTEPKELNDLMTFDQWLLSSSPTKETL